MRRIFLLSLMLLTGGCSSQDWRSASREPAGIAFAPAEFNDAVIEVYAADAYSWRGWFAVHTWIAVKGEGWLAGAKWLTGITFVYHRKPRSLLVWREAREGVIGYG